MCVCFGLGSEGTEEERPAIAVVDAATRHTNHHGSAEASTLTGNYECEEEIHIVTNIP